MSPNYLQEMVHARALCENGFLVTLRMFQGEPGSISGGGFPGRKGEPGIPGIPVRRTHANYGMVYKLTKLADFILVAILPNLNYPVGDRICKSEL